MPAANDAVWISVLPDMSGFGPSLAKGAGSEVDKAGTTLGSRMGGKMKMALAASGAAIGATIAKGISDNINIGKANDKLAAQLGLTAKESERMGKVAGGLYRNAYGDSLEQVNEALRGVTQNVGGMADASEKKLSGITAKVLDVSTAFDQDLGMTTAAVGQLMKTGMAKNATEALDIITKGLQSPANKADDLMETMNEYGTQFRKLGLDGKDAMGLLSQGVAAGARDADVVADALKEFSIRSLEALETTTATGEVIDTELGQAFKNVLPDTVNMYKAQKMLAQGGEPARKAFKMMSEGLANIKDPADRTKTAVALFGTQAEDLGDSLYALNLDTAAKDMGKVKGAAKEMGDTLNDNFATRMETWKRTVMGFVQDGLMKLADVGGKAFDWAKENQGLLTGFVVTMGALTAVTVAHGIATSAAAAGGMSAWIAQIARASTLGKVYAAVQWAINAALTANPIGLVVAGLALLVGGLILAFRKSETFRNIVNGAFQKVKDVAKSVSDWFGNSFVPFFTKTIPDAFRTLINWVKGNWPVILAVLTGPIGLAVLAITKNWDKITGAFQSAKDWVVGAFSKAWDATKAILLAPVELAKAGFDKLLGPDGPIRGAFSKAVDGIERIWDGLKKVATAPVRFLVETVYNDGLRKMIGALPGVSTPPEVKLGFASGGVLPGFTPGRDVHQFYSRSGGRLDLSGGEAIMRPEWTRRVGANGVAMLNAAARKGGSALDAAMASVVGNHGPHRRFFLGGVMPLPGTTRISQHTSGYPWARWAGDLNSPNDHLAPPVVAWAPGTVASAGWGGSDSYGNVMRVNHGGQTTLYAHLSSFIKRAGAQVQAGQPIGRVGSTGNSSGPHLHFELSGGSASAGASGSASLSDTGSAKVGGSTVSQWLSAIGSIKSTLSNVKDGIAKLGNMTGGFAGLMAKSGRSLGNSAIQWINDKIPNRFLPDNPIPGLFDQGGWLQPGQYGVNRTTQPEAVLTPSQWSSLNTLTASSLGGNSTPLDGKALLAEQRMANDLLRSVDGRLRDIERATSEQGVKFGQALRGEVVSGQRRR